MSDDERPGSGRAAGRSDRSRRRGPDDEIGPDVGREAERPPLAAEATGSGLLRADEVGTAAFVLVAIAGAAVPDTVTAALVVVSLAGLAVGIGAFLWAYAVAVDRSRTDAIGMGGLFFLVGSAPAGVRRRFTLLLVAQVVVAFAAASVRPFTPVAFAVLFPMYGLGLSGLWGARHGAFPPRVRKERGDGRSPPGRGAGSGRPGDE